MTQANNDSNVAEAYESPAAVGNTDARPRQWYRMVLISVAIIVLPLLGGLGGTVFGMLRTFSEISDSETVSAEGLADGIGFALWTSLLALPISLLGFVLLIFSVYRWRRADRSRRKWMRDSKTGD